MDVIQATKKTKKRVRQIKRQLDLHSDDKVIELLLNKYESDTTQDIKGQVTHQPSIRSQLLNLMSDGNTWNISDLATEVSAVNQDYDEVKDFVESILETVSEITKVGDARYRLFEH
jgi:uncharacterized protein YmfQ (DUF2313 family)